MAHSSDVQADGTRVSDTGAGFVAGEAAAPVGVEQTEITEDVLREYRYALGRSALGISGRFRARANMTSGLVRVRLEWRLGHFSIQVQESSGNARLDVLALEILREAVARTPLPSALRQRSFDTILPVQTRTE
ncbi:MAG: hypothetical protein LBR88_05810 [Zoogloeaceae bacterium]|nr:hypothetical protein [Zoogloeaceae bacterium]